MKLQIQKRQHFHDRFFDVKVSLDQKEVWSTAVEFTTKTKQSRIFHQVFNQLFQQLPVFFQDFELILHETLRLKVQKTKNVSTSQLSIETLDQLRLLRRGIPAEAYFVALFDNIFQVAYTLANLEDCRNLDGQLTALAESYSKIFKLETLEDVISLEASYALFMLPFLKNERETTHDLLKRFQALASFFRDPMERQFLLSAADENFQQQLRYFQHSLVKTAAA
jgi:hypothetical protein